MITLENDSYAKLQQLDEIFSNITLDELKQLTEPHRIVDRLKGTDTQHQSLFMRLLMDNNRLESDVLALRMDLANLKSDLQTLVKVLCKPQFDPLASSEFYALKSKHNIY